MDGRPKCRPAFFARARPSDVRSRIKLRSNSASPPRTVRIKRPVGVAGWETELVEKLPKGLAGSLPTVEEIEAELMPKRRKP